jgi:hypothetical protein
MKTDFKKAAAGDKEDSKNGTGKPKKAETKKDAPAVYVAADTKKVKRGFVLQFVNFVARKGSATADDLITEFAGRSVNGKKVTQERIRRYLTWCSVNDVLKKK